MGEDCMWIGCADAPPCCTRVGSTRQSGAAQPTTYYTHTCLQAAIMEALREVSEGLSAELDTLFKHDYLEQAVTGPFFQEVRCALEWIKGGGALNQARRKSSIRSSEACNAGRCRTMNHLIAVVEMRPEQLEGPRQQRLAARRAAQPCLWRCIFRFLSAMRGAAQQKVSTDGSFGEGWPMHLNTLNWLVGVEVGRPSALENY